MGDPQSTCLQVSCACVPGAGILTWFRDTADGSLPLEEGLPPIMEEERERSGRRSRSFGAAAVIAGLCCASVVAVLAMRFKHVPVVELVQNSQVRVQSLLLCTRFPENSNPPPPIFVPCTAGLEQAAAARHDVHHDVHRWLRDDCDHGHLAVPQHLFHGAARFTPYGGDCRSHTGC